MAKGGKVGKTMKLPVRKPGGSGVRKPKVNLSPSYGINTRVGATKSAVTMRKPSNPTRTVPKD
jgi:hypothetical protein